MGPGYTLAVARPARRALAEELPLKVATAAWELIDGPLRERPRVVGKPLRAPFDGQWVARRGGYRVRYRIDEQAQSIVILDVRARADVYRS